MVDQPRPVRHMRGVTVIGGGMVTPADLSVALSVAPLLVAADGGADRALALGHAPERAEHLAGADGAGVATDG